MISCDSDNEIRFKENVNNYFKNNDSSFISNDNSMFQNSPDKKTNT